MGGIIAPYNPSIMGLTLPLREKLIDAVMGISYNENVNIAVDTDLAL